MRINKAILFVLLVCISLSTFAQKGSIDGYIGDKQTSSPLSAVNVSLLNTSISDNTNDFGIFHFKNLKPGQYELTISHIGYVPENVIVNIVEEKTTSFRIELNRTLLNLSSVTVNSKKPSGTNSVAAVDIKLRPVNTSQDILRMVNGLFIAQHAGGGKAEQIFLRGYDIDHGTDINITVDGMPVNMVSHAHGQGYADLHFLIPETVERVNFDKGPYFTAKGNLATAGFVEMQTKDFLQNNIVKIQAGQFNTKRVMGMFKLLNKQNNKTRQQLYVASEYFKSEGYFEAPQNFHRFNVMAKYNTIFNNNSHLTIIASTLDSRWNASGQVPERAVESGMISRFGSIDNSEGGNTSRTNISVKFSKQWKSGWNTTDQFYFTSYHFNLFSNFTFFLNDPINGDEINQQEKRNVYGYTGTMTKNYFVGNKKSSTDIGWGFRYDDVRNIQLDNVVKREFLAHVQQGTIHEANPFVYINQNIELNNKFNINAGLRYDHFKFGYKNILLGEDNFRNQTRSTISPKINFSYTPNTTVKIYLNTGIGFHSNDTRVILRNSANDILPKVFGADLGIVLKPTKNLIIKTALWQFYSQQEFVYVGDAGIVEPGGKTKRNGIDLSVRYQTTKWLFADVDVNYARPRSIGTAKGEDYVPLAPAFSSIGGLTAKSKKGFSGSLRYRLLSDRPAKEDNSIIAEGYFLVDGVLSYAHKNIEFSVCIENILNTKWKEAQFDTESRLQFEPATVSEIHYTPGTPLFFKAGISMSF